MEHTKLCNEHDNPCTDQVRTGFFWDQPPGHWVIAAVDELGNDAPWCQIVKAANRMAADLDEAQDIIADAEDDAEDFVPVTEVSIENRVAGITDRTAVLTGDAHNPAAASRGEVRAGISTGGWEGEYWISLPDRHGITEMFNFTPADWRRLKAVINDLPTPL